MCSNNNTAACFVIAESVYPVCGRDISLFLQYFIGKKFLISSSPYIRQRLKVLGSGNRLLRNLTQYLVMSKGQLARFYIVIERILGITD